jgi:UDP-3-O-[3-hydroxymyristoyl] glucosamine N-acyltransferase
MIHSTAIVGLGPCVYARGPNGARPIKAVDNHGVELGEDVDILAFAAVVNGTERPTRIGRGSRLLHRAHVGHDCIIGEDVIVGVRSLVAGFAEIGDRTELKIGCLVRNRVKIGKNCVIGMGAVVVSDIPDNSVAYGNPAVVVRQTGA